MYRACVSAGQCSNSVAGRPCNWGKPDREDHPINCINWHHASKFCEWAGGSLPSEAQWEYAARGSDSRIYPWGNQRVTCDLAICGNGCGQRSTWPVCSRPLGNSPFGLCDMSGNVQEWVMDRVGVKRTNALSSPEDRVMRGGCWNYDRPRFLRASVRSADHPDFRHETLGFRCASTRPRQAAQPAGEIKPAHDSNASEVVKLGELMLQQ